jgi:hypothetical protein
MAVTDSVHHYSTELINYSYKNLLHRLQKKEDGEKEWRIDI